MEKEKEENIWKKKMFGPQSRKRTETEKEQNTWRGKIFIEGKCL